MTEPVRLQISRRKGFRLQEHSVAINGLQAVKVCRPGKFGNPFSIADAVDLGYISTTLDDGQQFVVDCFRDWIGGGDKLWMGPESDRRRQEILTALPDLRGKNIACWCREGTPCHGDVLLEMAAR